MKKTMAIFLLLMAFSQSAFAFDLYGSWWKATFENPVMNETTTNLLKLEKNRLTYGFSGDSPVSFDAQISDNDDIFSVTFPGGTIEIKEGDEEENIKVTWPHPRFPKDIVYTRISDEEAAKLLQLNR